MRLSTKSILRPLRATTAGGPISLSFLTRRRASKKRGGGGENEPSSPKVTCIGQVRSKKSKRRVKRCRSVTNRPPLPRLVGEASFRNGDQRSNSDDKKICSGSQRYSNGSAHYQPSQRWVHLPISVCDALRAFGAEFGRLFLCRRSCCFSSREREKADGGGNGRWVVSVSDEGTRREIEVVVDGGDAAAAAVEGRMSFRSSRRHVFEDIEVKDHDEEDDEEEEEEEEGGRVSVSIPPKNALLLMRCRSDPVKMAELGHRFSWDAAAAAASEHGKGYVEEDEKHGEETMSEFERVRGLMMLEGKDGIFVVKECDSVDEGLEQDVEITDKESKNDADVQEVSEGELVLSNEEREDEALAVEEEEEEVEALLESENTDQHDEHCAIQVSEEETPICHLSSSADSDKETNGGIPVEEEAASTERETQEGKTEEETDTRGNKGLLAPEEATNEREKRKEEEEERESTPALPDCLLLMIREPKLSMEVSKETWVRGTDFIRRLPRRPAKAGSCGHEPPVKRPPSKPKPSIPAPPSRKCDQLPPRSSCSLPTVAAPVGKVIEPLVLMRCKSAPMRTAVAKLAPESCLWKNGGVEMELHRRATIGVGSAGVGY